MGMALSSPAAISRENTSRGEMVARSEASITSRISGVEPASKRMSISKCCEAARPVSTLVRLLGRTGSASGTSASAAHRDLAAARHRVASPRDQVHLGAGENLGVGDPPAPVAIIDPDLDAARRQPFLDLAAVTLQRAQPDAGKAVADFACDRRDQPARGDRHRPERDFAMRFGAFAPRGIGPGLGIGHQRAGARQHAFAEFGQHDAASGAVEKPVADRALQRRDLPAQRRLRNADNGRGAGVAAIGRDLDEGFELSDIHENFGIAVTVILV